MKQINELKRLVNIIYDQSYACDGTEFVMLWGSDYEEDGEGFEPSSRIYALRPDGNVIGFNYAAAQVPTPDEFDTALADDVDFKAELDAYISFLGNSVLVKGGE